MAELKLSTSSAVEDPLGTVDGSLPPKKKSGCGCLAIGCAVILVLILGPIIGAGVWVATMDDAEWGEKLISVTQMEGFGNGFKSAIQQNDKLTAEQKKALLDAYDKFATTYPNLPADKKQKVSENLFKLIKMAIFDSDKFEGDPPREMLDLIEVFDPNLAAQLKGEPVTSTGTGTGVTVSPTPTPTPTPTPSPTPTPTPTPSTNPDPFSFDLPGPTPTPTPTPGPTPTPSPGPSPFDF